MRQLLAGPILVRTSKGCTILTFKGGFEHVLKTAPAYSSPWWPIGIGKKWMAALKIKSIY